MKNQYFLAWKLFVTATHNFNHSSWLICVTYQSVCSPVFLVSISVSEVFFVGVLLLQICLCISLNIYIRNLSVVIIILFLIGFIISYEKQFNFELPRDTKLSVFFLYCFFNYCNFKLFLVCKGLCSCLCVWLVLYAFCVCMSVWSTPVFNVISFETAGCLFI